MKSLNLSKCRNRKNLASRPERNPKSSIVPRAVLPRLCVSLSLFSGRRISAMTTFRPDAKSIGPKTSGLLEYSLDSFIGAQIFNRVSLRAIVDQAHQKKEI